MAAEPAAAAVAVPLPRVESAERANVRLLTLLALGHLVIDANQGALAAILPHLKSGLGLTYAATGTIVLLANVTSSLIQPIFGYLADQTARRWILPLSVLLASVGIGLLGLAPSYGAVLGLVAVAGFGAASFHPEGYRTATAVAGARKATGVSIFTTGGNIGIAIGPPLVTVLIAGFGLPGTLGMLGPGLAVTLLLLASLPTLAAPAAERAQRAAAEGARNDLRAMGILIGAVSLRSWAQLGFTTFVPFYYLEVLHGDQRMVGTLLAVFLGAGVVGTLFAGPIADRIGPRRFLMGVFPLAAPIACAFLLVGGPVGALIVLAALGIVLVSAFSVSVVLSQAYMPRNPGMASGLVVGFAIGAGGLGVQVLGAVADHWGLAATLWVSALTPLAGFAVSLFLPEPRRR